MYLLKSVCDNPHAFVDVLRLIGNTSRIYLSSYWIYIELRHLYLFNLRCRFQLSCMSVKQLSALVIVTSAWLRKRDNTKNYLRKDFFHNAIATSPQFELRKSFF